MRGEGKASSREQGPAGLDGKIDQIGDFKRNDEYGGEGEIRTPEALSGLLAFEASALNRSATSPLLTGNCRPICVFRLKKRPMPRHLDSAWFRTG